MEKEIEKNCTVYVLQLEGGKYYVGRTKNVEKRYRDHLAGKGSAYTKKYTPISILKVIEKVDPFEEDKITLEYMYRYGIDNVRGGSYAMVNLSEVDIYAIKKKIWGAMDLCFVCGRSHFSNRCREEYDVYGDEIRKCKRCLRRGHLAFECIEEKNTFQKNILKSSEEFPVEDNPKKTEFIEEDSSDEEIPPENPLTSEKNSPRKNCCIIL